MACWLRGALFFISRYIFLVIWIVINNLIFWTTYYNYKRKPQHYYTRSIIGRGLCISRGTAAVLNLSCGLILLPVCRGLNSFIYRILNRISRSLLTRWLSSLKVIHMTFAFTIVLASVTHSLAHVINATNFSRYYNTKYEDINWAKYKDESPTLLILTSVAGITGIAMVILLFLMLLLSMKCVRESYYDLFWSSHYLFLPFLILVMIHPIGGLLKEQINYYIHIPGCYNIPYNSTDFEGVGFPEPTYGDPGVCTAQPVFLPIKSQTWLWVTVPLVIYTLDFVFRLIRRNHCYFFVSSTIQFPGNVTQLTLIARTTHKFSIKPGQYILLQCPVLSSLEWHPFTVTSSLSTSSHTRITVLIRQRGDWTKSVCKALSMEGGDRILSSSHKQLKLLVDGPFCSPLESMLKYSRVICIAAGIGITPFAALFSHLLNHDYARLSYPQHIHLVWTVRSYDHLIWFSHLISSLHQKFWYLNQPDRLEICLYVTRGEFSYNSLGVLLGKDSTVLLNCIQKGRPNWTELFKEWAQFHQRSDTPVFLCGPKSMTKQVRAICTILKKQGYAYKCIHEAFS